MASITDQNYLAWNQGKHPLVNFNFMLRVELLFDLPCKSVRAFSKEMEFDYIQEGGLNDYVHMRRKPISKPFTLEVERYVGVDYVDPLPLGAELVLPVMLFVSRNQSMFIPGLVARTYVFTGVSVIKKTYGDLVADQSGLLVETTTLSYREMLCVDIPWSELGENIGADAPIAPPNSAATADKSLEQLKQEGQEACDRAVSTQVSCDAAFNAADADALLGESKGLLQRLQAAVKPGGTLDKAVTDAQNGLLKDGKPLTELADEANKAELAAQKVYDASYQDWFAKQDAWHAAQTKADAAAKKLKDAEEQIKAINSQIAQTTAELEAIPAQKQSANSAITAGAELAAAKTKETDAKKKQSDALAALDKDLTDAKAKESALKPDVTKAEAELTTAKSAADASQKIRDSAKAAMDTAQKKAYAAQNERDDADRRFTAAKKSLASGKKYLLNAQNACNQLPVRKNQAVPAQAECKAALEPCKASNNTLQSAGSVEDAQPPHKLVLSHAKTVTGAYRTVQDTAQYMTSTRKQNKELAEFCLNHNIPETGGAAAPNPPAGG